MIEKFSDTLSASFLNKEGVFVFTITSGEIKDAAKGPMAVLEAKSDAGTTTLYHSLSPKAKWSYANLVKACFKLDTSEKIEAFAPHDGGIDYEIIHNQLIGKTFLGVVECKPYEKEIKVPNDDGTFTTDKEVKDGYKVIEYQIAD